MGYLHYGSTTTALEVEDSLLAHVRAVALTKLRRHEAFALTIPHGDLNETLWVADAIPLRFVLDDHIRLDRALLADMMAAANSANGLDLSDARFAERLENDPRLEAVSA